MRRLLAIPFTLLIMASPHAIAPLSVSAVLPRFMRQGDVASISAVVTNSGPDGDALLSIVSLDPIALRFDDASSQLVHLASGASETVRFVAMARSAGTARVRISATLGRDSVSIDAAQTIVMPLGLETIAASGETVDRAAVRIDLPRNVEPNVGGV